MTLPSHSVSGAAPAVRRAVAADAPLLARLAAETFAETFAADNDPRDMAAYAASAFGEALQGAELRSADNTVLIAERDGDAVGYAMLRRGVPPACVPTADALEIARLYAVRRAIGSGVGAALMQACLAEAAASGRTTLWLGVWERNLRAIDFYRRWEFRDVGAQGFQLGADLQTDRVMMRRVAEPA